MKGGQQSVRDGVHRRHMHGGGENVVGRLTQVHLVIGVHTALLTALGAQQLAGAVGQHFVDVHVGLRAGARLPDDQGELVGVLPCNHFIGGGDDGLGLVWGQQTQGMVHPRRAAFDLRQRTDDLGGHSFAGDVEILQRALGLRTPQPLRGHVNRAEAVALGATGLAAVFLMLLGEDHGLGQPVKIRSWNLQHSPSLSLTQKLTPP